MRGFSVGRVVESNNSEYAVGDIVSGGFGWQDYAVSDGGGISSVSKVPRGTPLTMPLSVLGVTGITAYFGMKEIGQVKEGDVVLVSGAAGRDRVCRGASSQTARCIKSHRYRRWRREVRLARNPGGIRRRH